MFPAGDQPPSHSRRLHSPPSAPPRYAELNEPFEAYFDKASDRSRTDYYHGDYKVYQFGPSSAPELKDKYGAAYKLVFVPASFHPPSESAAGRARQTLGRAYETLKHKLHLPTSADRHRDEHVQAAQPDGEPGQSQVHKSQVKRVCFAAPGGVGYTVAAQTVLPNLADFSYDSTGPCPRANLEHRHARGQLWKLASQVGGKKNTYKFWLRRDTAGNLAIPVHYYMLGLDSLPGSHYDRCDVGYCNFQPDGVTDESFALDGQPVRHHAGPPGNSASRRKGKATRRAHQVAHPIHGFVAEPHRYDHVGHHLGEFELERELRLGG